eukprot:TRINITY_DN23961_c0_g2_i2.p1 TRINITY_DN23961_c0_g2~~TRINITY_DN23961_c0_g2_i2.p1  ORF type:complete len:191 (+),score=8.75 TRINITY_DN23961_c0_g2_i2:367-939(+)
MARRMTFALGSMLLATALLSVTAQTRPLLPNRPLIPNLAASAGSAAASATAKALRILPKPAGMLRGVMTACSGLQTVQAGLANIQITQWNASYLATYTLYVTGAASAPTSAVIYKGNPCSTTAAAASLLSLPGNWTQLDATSYALAAVQPLQQAEAAAVVAEIRPVGNTGLYVGLTGAAVVAGKLIGGRF